MISDSAQKYLQKITSFSQITKRGDSPRVQVDFVASRLANLYEKLRQVIDYQEDHLLRRNTIERIIKRRLLLSADPEEIARPFIQELIRGGYFLNDEIPDSKVEDAKKIIYKYLFLSEQPSIKQFGLFNWLQGLAAAELEETLAAINQEMALFDFMREEMEKRLSFPDSNLSQEKKRDFIFIACQRALLKADQNLLSWRLLKLKFPEFCGHSNEFFLAEFSQKAGFHKKEIEEEIKSPFVKRVLAKVYNFVPSFLLIQDVAVENYQDTQKVFDEPEVLESKMKKAYEKRYAELKKNHRRWGIRWVISILLSKMLLAFLIEAPYDLNISHRFSLLALSVNLLFPPFLMFVIIASIKVPKDENKTLVTWQALKLVSRKEKTENILVEPGAKKGLVLRSVFLLSSVLALGSVIWVLVKIDFSWLSILVFMAFFSLIAFSGMKIEASAKQLRAYKEEDGILGFIIDIFFLPFRNVGKWLSGQLQKYNFIILILNLFFEAPLQTFFEFLEDWRKLLKEKKGEVE